MRVSKVSSRKSKVVDIEELNAYQMAYDQPLNSKDYTLLIGSPALLLGMLGLTLTYYWWMTLILFIIGAWYGYQVILPSAVKRNYEMNALVERNRFLNNMTQKLTDQDKTVILALKEVEERCYGELKDDIRKLGANLIGTDKEQIQYAFDSLSFKYREDVVFVQYLEQLETAVYEGNNNIESMKEIKENHNITRKRTENFLKRKNGYKGETKQMLFIVGAFILAISFAFGFQMFFEAYARSIVGWITSGIYIIVLGVILNKFVVDYFDDSIMTVRAKK